MIRKLRNLLKPRLKLVKGARFTSFLFIGFSVLIAAGILFAANMYYNIDTGEVVMEEVQRVTQTIRATAGLIVAGSASQNPASGVSLEVATGTVSLSGADQVLRFSGGTSQYIGIKAPTTGFSDSKVYILPKHGDNPPSPDYVLTWQSGDQLTWKPATSTGAGDITDVGDVSSGAAFTSGGSGTSLWFHNGSYTGQLTQGTLSANRTYTLPDLTGTIALTQAGNLGTGPVLFANSGLIATSSDLFWDNTNGRLGIKNNTPVYPLDVAGAIRSGRSGAAGQIIISNASGYGLTFQPNASMAVNITYTWPINAGTNNYVLTTDGSGNLSWTQITGVGAVTGTGAANYIAKWTSATNIATSSIVDNYTGGTALTIANDGNITITNALTVSGAGGVTSALYTGTGAVTYTSAATTTISSAASSDIILDPASGRITLGTGDYIKTASGYEIGKANTEILREMIPILGFDLPIQTATTSWVKISKTLENYPFVTTPTGATRVHKMVFRYAASTTADIYWRVATTSGAYATSTLPQPTSENLEQGDAYIATTTIPTDGTDWWVEVKTPTVPDVVRVFQVFLAAYDKIQ